MTSTEAPTESTVEAGPDIAGWVRHAVHAALDRKAVELQLLHLEPVTDFTDYFLVCSGMNQRQVQAIADHVQRTLREHKVRPLHVEGERTAQWVLMDYGDFVVHIFHHDVRDVYALERLWSDAPDVTSKFTPPEPS
ncbi:MAG: ribosome silencing factor [Acidobacteriota bacterium]